MLPSLEHIAAGRQRCSVPGLRLSVPEGKEGRGGLRTKRSRWPWLAVQVGGWRGGVLRYFTLKWFLKEN